QINYHKKHETLKTIRTEVEQVNVKLQQIGYINLQVNPLKKVNDSLYLSQFKLGGKYSSVKVYYDKASLPFESISRMGLSGNSEYFTLPFNQAEEILQQLSITITDMGRPFSTLSLTEIQPSD